MTFSFDASQVAVAARNITLAGAASKSAVWAVANKACVNIKTQMQQEARVLQGGRLAADISYDIKDGGNVITAEIGATLGDVGSLQVFYLGNAKIGPRLPDPMGAADAEWPRMKAELLEAIGL